MQRIVAAGSRKDNCYQNRVYLRMENAAVSRDDKPRREGNTGIGAQDVHTWLDEKRKDADFVKAPESRQHFDIWQFAKANGDSTYFGQMPPQVVENLLWFYTEPGDQKSHLDAITQQ